MVKLPSHLSDSPPPFGQVIFISECSCLYRLFINISMEGKLLKCYNLLSQTVMHLYNFIIITPQTYRFSIERFILRKFAMGIYCAHLFFILL